MQNVSMDQQQDDHQHGAGMELPPGFRFHPTDEELITHYLARKVADGRFSSLAVSDADLNKCEPWDLPSLARMGEKEWYFFVVKDRKYPTGTRTNRATEAGYWKATGKDKDVFRGGALVGMKKTLVFYTGRAPKGDKSGWVMHEYRLLDAKPHAAAASTSYGLPAKAPKNEWVLCRVFKKSLVGVVSASSSSSAPAAAVAKNGVVWMEMKKIGSSSMAGDVAAVSDPLPPLLDVSGAVAAPPCAFVDPAARVTCFSNSALEAGQFFNPTAAGCSTDDVHHDLASSSPFLAGFTQYGPLHYGAVSLVQLLESNGYHRGLVDDMAAGKQQPAAACKGERERLMSASQDTGLTSDVNPEISSSSGQKYGHDHAALWGY